MELTLSMFFGDLFGIYLLVVGVALIFHKERIKKALVEISDSHALLALTGIFSILLGSSVILTHNVWVNSWECVVTFLGWLLLVQGVARLWIPGPMGRWLKGLSANAYSLLTWVWILLGIYLLWSVHSQ